MRQFKAEQSRTALAHETELETVKQWENHLGLAHVQDYLLPGILSYDMCICDPDANCAVSHIQAYRWRDM